MVQFVRAPQAPKELLTLVLAGILAVGAAGQCVDTDNECMSMAMRGECQSNFAFMSVSCKASCGLCQLDEDAMAKAQTFEGRDGEVPLLYHNKDGSESELPPPTLVESDVKIRIYQPLLAEHCCWGATASVRYEVSGSIKVPEDGVVVFTFEGHESDAMPFSRGEFTAFVRHPGNYSVMLAVDDHEKTKRFVEERAVLVVAAALPAASWEQIEASLAAEDAGKQGGGGGGRVLRHALRAPEERAHASTCVVHCVPTETLADRRQEVAEAIQEAATPAGLTPFLLQIGACDGSSFDPVHDILKHLSWGGLLVEPLPDIFRRLQHTYAAFPLVTLANVAVTSAGQREGGGCEMLRVPPALVDDGHAPDWALGIASFFSDRTAVGGVGTDPADFETFQHKVVREPVVCVTMEELLAQYHVTRIDYLQIDAEGYDAYLLSQLDLGEWAPTAVALETINLPPAELLQAYRRLGEGGYRVEGDGRDLLAARFPGPQRRPQRQRAAQPEL